MKKLSILPLFVSMLALVGCGTVNPVVHQQTIKGVGACQGVFVHEDSVWVYGEKDGQGVMKRLAWVGPEDGGPKLVDSGDLYELTLFRSFDVKRQPDVKLGSQPIPHPTGFTHHPKLGTFIGNTANQKGTIFHIVWWGFEESGSLDDWIINRTIDDLAINGCRPEFVRWNGRWLIATADDGDQGNKLRLYDPEKLAKAAKTSDPGVLVAEFDCGPFIQSMHWIDEDSTLVLAQNQAAGNKDRLTLMKFGEGDAPPAVERVIDLDDPGGGLEGFAIVAPGWAVMTSAMKENNLSIIRWPIQAD